MTSVLLVFSLAVISAGYLTSLPSLYYFLPVLILVFFVKRYPVLWLLFAACAGFFYGILCGQQFLQSQLPDIFAGQDIMVEGQVVDLPQENQQRQLFSFLVSRAYFPQDSPSPLNDFPHKINLSSYDSLRVKSGERWRLCVKLKRPRGFVNPGGFDYQVSLLRKNIGATGYIRANQHNEMLAPQPAFSMDVLRYQLQQWLIGASQSAEKGVLVALLVGDTSLVDKQHWGEMLKTGTNHLIAISGLHLGFFAIVGFFIGNIFGRCIQLVWHRCPSTFAGHFFASALTLFYSIIAGLNIPTLRTLIMLAVVQLFYVWRRTFRGRDTLLWALVAVLLYDPLAAYDMGFWLSFGAVAMLIFCFSGRISANDQVRNPCVVFVVEFVKSQWVMFVGLLIPLALLVHTSSLLAPLANFLAIPVITFFVVPCLILAALCHFIVPVGEALFLRSAEQGLALVHNWLNYLLTQGAGKLNPLITFNPLAIPLAVFGVVLILLPRGLGNRKIGLVGVLLAFAIPLASIPRLQMLVFDVGQGTAVFVRTPNHQLLYDTGPVYSENFDAGSGIIVPYLQSQNITTLDKLIVSHNDKDHSGGLLGVLAAMYTDKLWLGEPEKYQRQPHDPLVENCHQQQPWQWDDVHFTFLTWPLNPIAKANNHSCVLLIEYQGQRVLLTGDIEKDVERSLLENNSLQSVDILLAPHHGSHTSSTAEFVARTHPTFVIYSAGFHNQHGHPHQDVQARYTAIGSYALNTALSGAVEFNWDGDRFSRREYRQFAQRYWFDKNTKE